MSDLLFRPITELAELVRSGEVSSRELVEESLGRIDEVDGEINAFTFTDPDGALAAADADLERGRAAVRRRPDRDQGPGHGGRRLAAHELLRPVRGLHARLRRLRRAAPPRGRVRPRRADGFARVRDRPGHGVAPLRPDAQPVGHQPDAGRLLGRLGRGGRRRDGPGGARERRRRLDPDPRLVLRARRPEGEPRPDLARAGIRRFLPRHRRDAVPDGRRDRCHARRDRGLRAGRRHLGAAPERAVRRGGRARSRQAADRLHDEAADGRRPPSRERARAPRRRRSCSSRSGTRSSRWTTTGPPSRSSTTFVDLWAGLVSVGVAYAGTLGYRARPGEGRGALLGPVPAGPPDAEHEVPRLADAAPADLARRDRPVVGHGRAPHAGARPAPAADRHDQHPEGGRPVHRADPGFVRLHPLHGGLERDRAARDLAAALPRRRRPADRRSSSSGRRSARSCCCRWPHSSRRSGRGRTAVPSSSAARRSGRRPNWTNVPSARVRDPADSGTDDRDKAKVTCTECGFEWFGPTAAHALRTVGTAPAAAASSASTTRPAFCRLLEEPVADVPAHLVLGNPRF